MLEAYTVRPYEPADRAAFLDLYEHVHGSVKSERWFEWKYGANPYVGELPMMVAERDGDLVGARPLFALPMRAGRADFQVRQPADAMVHAEHRRQGIFTRMIERAVDHCESSGLDFLFTFPNQRSGGAYEKLGWTDVGGIVERYRPQKPFELLSVPRHLTASSDGLGSRLIDLAGVPARLGRRRPAGIRTDIRQEPPVGILASLYRRSPPAGFHAPRTERFLEWRFGNPDWEYRTFLGYRDGDVAAAIVTAAGRWDGDTALVRCMDVLPVTSEPGRDAAIVTLLRDVIQAYADTTLFVLPSRCVPGGIGRRLGFVRTDRPPFDRVTDSTRLFVNPLSEAAREADVTSRDRWAPTFVEYDTA